MYAGRLVTYSGFAESDYPSREIGEAFELLEDTMLLSLVRASSDEGLPWNTLNKKQKKLIFLDLGLVNFFSGLSLNDVQRKDLHQLHRGRLAEQCVGQHLMSEQTLIREKLSYWIKDYREGSAEVDFCTSVQGVPVGMEVKSGSSGHLKSLFEFAKKVKNAKLVRIYSGELCRETRQGKEVLSIPFYLLPRWKELLQ